MGNRRIIVNALGLGLGAMAAACGADGTGADDPGDPEDPFPDEPPGELRCVATITAGSGFADPERHVIELSQSGAPLSSKLLRDGVVRSRWSFEYDSDGRLVAQRQDSTGGPDGTPDGEVDSERSVAHTATTAIETFTSPLAPDVGETVAHMLDAEDRVIRTEHAYGTVDYAIGPGGRLDRSDEALIDVDTQQPYTRRTEFGYGPDGRLRSRRVDDTRQPGPYDFAYAYEAMADALSIRRTGAASVPMRVTYRYDGTGRVTSAERDDGDDGSVDWRVDFALGADGATIATGRRGDRIGWVHEMSRACAVTIEGPRVPRAPSRPGPGWQWFLPAYPDAFE